MKRRIYTSVVGAVVILLVGAIAYQLFLSRKQIAELKGLITELQWDAYLKDQATNDHVQIKVGTIQFLKRGYSITLESVDYTQNGLVLSGDVGNPTHLTISSLTLNVAAHPDTYTLRHRFLKDGLTFDERFSGPKEIGRAQTSVGVLLAGRTASFRVTIPNVRQNPDVSSVRVWFSDERYVYLR